MEERKGLEQIEECLPLLFSGDWKKRLVGEYWETKIRAAALKEYIERRTEEEHKWNESMEHHIMSRQLSDMLGYLSCLGLRATEKNIDLMDTEIPEDEHLILIKCGEWENDSGYDDWYCSECGFEINYDGEYPTEYDNFKYCGCCGAKMQLED